MHLLLFLSPDWLLSHDYLLFKFTQIFIYFLFLSDEGPMFETLEYYIIRIGSTPTFLYFDLYFYSAYAAHYVYIYMYICCMWYLIKQNIYMYIPRGCSTFNPKSLAEYIFKNCPQYEVDKIPIYII